MRGRQQIITSWDSVPVIMDLPFAARIVGKSYDRLKKLCQMGAFPAFKVGGEWRVSKESLLAYTQGQWQGKTVQDSQRVPEAAS